MTRLILRNFCPLFMVYILLNAIAWSSGILALYLCWQIFRLPRNRPINHQKNSEKKVIVLAGDSITHGQIGENYVTMLADRLDDQQFNFVNAGINSHLAWNLLQRIDEIIECEPDFVTILIGINDANAVTSEKQSKDYVKSMKLPSEPSIAWYQETLYKIVTILQERTQAKIGLISIPPIGEDQDHFAFKISADYINPIIEVANQTGVTYLPFHEMILKYLEKHPGNPTYPIRKFKRKMFSACFKHYILGKDWDSIGQASGFQLHIDYLHLNTKGASMLSNLIEEFIKNS